MTYSALGVPRTQTLAVKDSVSEKVGDGFTYCGAREYAIATTPSSYYTKVLSFDTSTNVFTLGLPATALTDIGFYTIEITVKLKLYPTITKTATFIAHVTDCVVTSLVKTLVTD